jgi:hypothetical protein
MTVSTPSRVLRAALFTLVPIAYLSMRYWRPLVTYYHGKDDTSLYLFTILMAAILFVSLLSWNKHRVIAMLGMVAYVLWFAFWLLPVI